MFLNSHLYGMSHVNEFLSGTYGSLAQQHQLATTGHHWFKRYLNRLLKAWHYRMRAILSLKTTTSDERMQTGDICRMKTRFLIFCPQVVFNQSCLQVIHLPTKSVRFLTAHLSFQFMVMASPIWCGCPLAAQWLRSVVLAMLPTIVIFPWRWR